MTALPHKQTQRNWLKIALVAGIVALLGAVVNHYLSEWIGADK